MTPETPWQLRIFSKSLKKKEKLTLLQAWLGCQDGRRVLDLGCAKGTLSLLMRELGGSWVHADLDRANLLEALSLVDRGVVQLGPAPLPFPDRSFDTVVSLDFIEHIQDDQAVLEEVRRILKPGGTLLLSTPITGRLFLVNRLKRMLGLPPSVYGHVREGYRLTELCRRLEQVGFRVTRRTTYARLFTELVEMVINLGFVWMKRGGASSAEKRDGAITPGSGDELKKYRKAFRLYSLIYPITWSISRLDRLIPFLSGYATLILADSPGSEAASP